jgi:N-acylneuraminate cytidylyltransferase
VSAQNGQSAALARILGLVVARGGSKGVPRKNLRLLGGHPLVAYAVRAGVKAPSITDVVISTDDREIADAARRYGARVPFLRPPELASDTSPVLLSIRHAIETLAREGERYDGLCLLQPTTPFRSVDDLEAGIALLREHPEADSVVALMAFVDAHPARLRRIEDGRVAPFLREGGDVEGQQRQDFAQEVPYRRCGGFYLSRVRTVLEKNSLYGDVSLAYVMPEWRCVNIDAEHELQLARAMLESPHFAKELAHVPALFEP